jgi:hypothetical protein
MPVTDVQLADIEAAAIEVGAFDARPGVAPLNEHDSILRAAALRAEFDRTRGTKSRPDITLGDRMVQSQRRAVLMAYRTSYRNNGGSRGSR